MFVAGGRATRPRGIDGLDRGHAARDRLDRAPVRARGAAARAARPRRGAADRRARRDLRRRHRRLRRRAAVRPPPRWRRRCRRTRRSRASRSASSAATLGFWFAGLYQDWLPGHRRAAHGRCASRSLAPVGDLFESMIKRDLDVKDAGNIFGPTAASSTASTRSCSRSSPATTWPWRSSTRSSRHASRKRIACDGAGRLRPALELRPRRCPCNAESQGEQHHRAGGRQGAAYRCPVCERGQEGEDRKRLRSFARDCFCAAQAGNALVCRGGRVTRASARAANGIC